MTSWQLSIPLVICAGLSNPPSDAIGISSFLAVAIDVDVSLASDVPRRITEPLTDVGMALDVVAEVLLSDTDEEESNESDTVDGLLFVEDNTAPARYETVAQHLLSEKLHMMLAAFTPREHAVITLRYGIGNGRSRTLLEVGQELGISRERVRQLEVVALKKLRTFSEGDAWQSRPICPTSSAAPSAAALLDESC